MINFFKKEKKPLNENPKIRYPKDSLTEEVLKIFNEIGCDNPSKELVLEALNDIKKNDIKERKDLKYLISSLVYPDLRY